MNVTVNSQILAAELRLLNKIVPSKPIIAILSHALFEANDKLSLYATDLEVGLSTDCEARVEVPGRVALPVAKLLSLLEQFPDAGVNIALDKQHVTVRCGAFKSRLQVLSVDDFPEPPIVNGPSSVLNADALRSLITRVRPAVSSTVAKYVLQGALFSLVGPAAVMVATDGKRLSIATIGRTGTDQRVIVPVKALDLLAGGTDEGDVDMTVGTQHMSFAINGKLLTSRMLGGKFPKYEKIVPQGNDKIVKVDRSAFMAALKRIILVSEENGATYFHVTPGMLELSTSSAEVGSANEIVNIEYDGESLKVCVNGNYVLDFLEVATKKVVSMALKDASSAMLLTDGDDHVGVIMLMRER